VRGPDTSLLRLIIWLLLAAAVVVAEAAVLVDF
jgi:hypothetical protein